MSFDEKFLKKNCAKEITISSNQTEIYNTWYCWNTCYGNVIIEPQKFLTAQYKWTIVTQNNTDKNNTSWKNDGKSVIMAIGMISTTNNRNYSDAFWCDIDKGTPCPAYYYHCNGLTTNNINHIVSGYSARDKITMDVNIKTKKITFQKNNKHIDTMDIDILTTYVFVVSMSECGMKLKNFEYNLGNVEEKKQNETWQSNQFLNLRHMVTSLQDQLLVKMKEIKQLENINNDMIDNYKKELMKSKRELQTTNNRKQVYKNELNKTKNKLNKTKKLNQSLTTEKDATIQKLKQYKNDKVTFEKQKQLLQNKLNKTRKQLNDCLLKQEEEKKDENAKGLQHELITLADKMNAFYIKYDENMLCNIYNNNPDSLFVEQDIDNVSLSCNSLEKRLGEMKNYVISVTKPNVNEYKLWDINTMILWIKSLDNGHFIKYCDVLRKGFEGDCISADDLPNIGQSDLATTPFDIRVFKDRKRLAKHFKSLEQNQIANTNNEGLATPYI